MAKAAAKNYERRRMSRVVFSSESVEWETPPLFARLDREFRFTLDVCASSDNAKCPRFWSKVEDGLVQPWDGVCWMNPPYGREIGRWVRRAYHQVRTMGGPSVVVCLLPAKTETRWWWEYVRYASEIRLLRGRLRFGGCNVDAPFPSAVVVFRRDGKRDGVTWYEPTPAERGVKEVA